MQSTHDRDNGDEEEGGACTDGTIVDWSYDVWSQTKEENNPDPNFRRVVGDYGE
jgi:hypothetical protein